MREPDIPRPVAPARRPTVVFPAGATDCHAHVFGPQDRYPLLPATHFVPHETPWPDYRDMLRSLGCSRAVLVQPSVYGTDNSAIEHALVQAPGDGFQLRAVAVLAPDVADAELDRLHALGFRGVRINTASGTKGLRLEHALPLARRIARLGWHLQFYCDLPTQPELDDVLAQLPVPVVIDHFGRVRSEQGVDSEPFRRLLRLLAHPHCWAKLSGVYFTSSRFPAYEDIAPLARAMVDAAADRLVWGTDWPHASAREKMQADADLADLLGEWVPDAAARRRVLVDNPARLYGFA